MKKKEKKEKIIYIDDGRTIADMSNLHTGAKWTKQGTGSSVGDIFKTYWNATKMMFKPTLIAVGFVTLVFAIVSLLLLLVK